MASGSQITSSSTKQKTDLAWKHCQLINHENSCHLMCLYCTKIFKGGGIHRMKEHLAGRKGNGSICLKVPLEVRQILQESLELLEPRRKRKSKGDVALLDSNQPTIDALPYQDYTNERMNLVPIPIDLMEPSSGSLVREDGRAKKNIVKRKRHLENIAFESSDIIPIEGNLDKSFEIPHALFIRGLPDEPNQNTFSSFKKNMDHIDMAVGRFLFDIGAPLSAVNSSYFQPMIDVIASSGSNVVAPSYHNLRGRILKNMVEEVKGEIANYPLVWEKTGCSLLVEQWTNGSDSTVLSFSVHCSTQTVFWKNVTLPSLVESSELLVEVIKQVVEEVGGQNVVQVITSGEEHFADAGKTLMQIFPNLYWAPCASRNIDLILEDFTKIDWVGSVIRQAQLVTRFIYNNVTILNLMRKFTFGDDIVEHGESQSAAHFMSLKRMVGHKMNLQAMLTSEEWMNCPLSKKPEGLEILDTVTSQSFWSSCIRVTRLTNPLLKLRRIVRSEKKTAMGFVYAGIYRAKEEIKKELGNEGYLAYWDIIDHRWERVDRLPLHAAGFYLNPKYFYGVKGDMPGRIMSGMFDCIERIVTDIDVQDKIIKEMNSYKSAAGDFGRNMAIRSMETLLPAEWWSIYGGSCPNLKSLAIRILGQTCSADVCRSLHISFDQVNNAKNNLEYQRLNDLLYARCNLRLRDSQDREYHSTDPISSEFPGVIGDWVNGMDFSSRHYDGLDWVLIEPPASPALLRRSPDETEDLGVERRISILSPTPEDLHLEESVQLTDSYRCIKLAESYNLLLTFSPAQLLPFVLFHSFILSSGSSF
ncbi:hypothetical protein SAY86_014067 [Trapa natans]|uniref:BED-type domain-containing protein n=1 Tax=Trapa natans TaxID=22666 RepID=A0AAN7QMH6_TRANT|nr:hypothetical protein SAY86_014067 [Trapa natans]